MNMKSIIAQMDYTHRIRLWQSNGVPFDVHLYVPETHPDTNEISYEQEDIVHLLKVLWYSFTISILIRQCPNYSELQYTREMVDQTSCTWSTMWKPSVIVLVV